MKNREKHFFSFYANWFKCWDYCESLRKFHRNIAPLRQAPLVNKVILGSLITWFSKKAKTSGGKNFLGQSK